MISSLVTNNWITIIFILMIGLLVFANYFFEKRFLKFRTLFQSKQYFVDYVSITTVFHPFNILFLIFQASCYALLTLKVVVYFNKSMIKNQLFLFLKLAFAILFFYLIRYLLGKVISLFFNLKKDHEALSFMKLSHLSKVALIVFPFLVLFNYLELKNGVLFIGLAIYTVTLLLIKYVYILQQNQKVIFSNLLYFILYLCTLEIIPLLLIYKVLIIKV